MEFQTFEWVAVLVAFGLFAAAVLILQARQTGKWVEALTTVLKQGADSPALLAAIHGVSASVPPQIVQGLLGVLEGLEAVTPPSGDELLNALEELIRRAKDNVDAEDEGGEGEDIPPDAPAPDARPDVALS